MKIKVNKFLLDKLIFMLMLFYILIDIWLGLYTNIIEVIITSLCIVSILISWNKIKTSKRQSIVIFLMVVNFYLAFNYLISISNTYWWDNLIYVFKCIVIAIYFGVELSTYSEELESLLVSFSKFLNLYMILNILIMILQLNESYFLIDRTKVVYYPDCITGLFGINGTHRLTLFSIFLLCFDLYLYKNKRVKDYKMMKVFIIIISILLLFLATQNDNNTFIIIYPMFIGLTYCALYVINLKRILKIIIFSVAILVGIVTIVMNNPIWFSEILVRLDDIFSVYVLRESSVWDERAEYLQIAFTQGGGYFFGSGLGSVKMYSDARLGLHWGMNSLMTFVYFIGIGPLLMYLWSLFNIILNKKKQIRNMEIFFVKICLFVLSCFFVQYCQLLSEMNLMILYGMIMCVFSFSVNSKYLKE